VLPQLPRSTAGVAVLADLATEHGMPVARLLAGTGVSERALHDPAAEIPASAELAVVRNLVTDLGHVPGLGLLAGHRFHVGLFGIWGFALLTSPTVREAVGLAVRFVDLTFSFSRLEVTESPEGAMLEFDDAGVAPDVRSFLLERDIASAARLQQDILGEPVSGLRVELATPAPADTSVWTGLLGIQPRFGAERNLLVLPAASLDRPLPQANPLVTAASRDQCAALLRTRHERIGVAGQVRAVLVTGPPARFRQEEVAAALHLSPRTLHRRLAEEGTTYRDLVTETTILLAQEMLAARLTVEATATRLGYAGAPAFTVAFRKATGMSPGSWARARLRT
jgi:AraC-like DNA-binding protein